ncbi:hypothetical protein, variant 7 [Phytophthora nicotianae]|uniref:Uncharacterized protein n=2 Tax=Phytophthora nicotianae TaxID=4792 RepID=W2LN71_PHYNI|nr:hypothetical protein, variant 4 [Phytophthora nicotianae]ETL98895.1 hypothetical protein, variant 5 [Phytophthora nicotianae]ETL98896.1 hypothetical protein, variant 6 [Phytophthora nicotianae]ETL98897.1 hypothetical protein, variant 7 [Phytophthora nicotianae]
MPPNGGDAAATPVRSRPLLHYKDLGLGTQNRKVRFTCVHASENFIACGANNGSVYLYATSALGRSESDRVSAKYHLVKTISPPSNDRVAVTCLSICPLQKRLVVGTMRGVVYAIQLSDYHKIGEKVEFSHDFHAGFPVTCFLWDRRGTRLFSACNAGLVCQTVLRAGVSAIFGSTDTELLLKEETGIVQLDLAKSERSYILMVSSQLRVLLLNLTAGDGSAVQIGTKARQGSYGACFFSSLNVEAIDPAKKREIRVFSSRPGRRVWVADPQSGTVSSTLKFSLSKNPTQFLRSPECAMEEGIQPRNLSINKLGRFQFVQDPSYAPQDVKDATTLLVSWNVGSSVLFFLDPFAVEIVEWHLDLGIIHDLKIINETTLVVLHGDAPKVSLIQSCSADQFLQIYGSEDMKKAVELAVEFKLNDAFVLESLQSQWLAHLDKIGAKPREYDELTSSLKALVDKTKALEEEYRVAVESGLPTPTDSQPLQVIFKQRPQQAVSAAANATSDLFAGPNDSTDTEVTLGTGSTLHKPIEYFEVLAPSDQSYSKSICAPDGSFVEARLMEIPELPRANFVLADDYRENYMEEVMEEVKRSEQIRNEEGTMNMNLLPVLKDGSTAAAKAFSTFIPGSSMLTHLIDGSIITDPFGRSDASGIFNDFPEFDGDELVIDPDPRLLQRRYTHGQRLKTDTNECSVLRIAMSTIGEADESNLDTEVLLEAISMDIWDSNLKYTSNLPISEQLNLPESGQDSKENGSAHAGRWHNEKRVKENERQAQLRDSKPALIEPLKVQTSIPTAPSSGASTPVNKIKQRLVHRASMSPDASRAAQRAIQKHFGATPSCEIKLKCIVGGRIAVSPELEPTIRRDVTELASELHAASATAEKTKHLARRLWPASGITRVCACLTSLYLLQGDMHQVQTTISAWLNCFDPTAQHEGPEGSDDSIENKSELTNAPAATTGFARGEALVDGDGLPLTRGDWNLVRTLVSIYFAIWAAGSKLHLHPLNQKDHADGEFCRLYETEMGITMTLEPRYQWDSDDDNSETESTTAEEAEAFVAKYGVYINPDLAAEVCNLRQFTGALKIVLDEVVASADMEETCDDIVSWISEKESGKAFSTLKERDSLCLLLHLLDILLKKCPQETIELCVSKYPVLYPWNIEQALFGKELDWEAAEEGTREIYKPATVAQTSKYFRYLVRLLEEKGDEAGKDAKVVSRCLELCFAGDAVVANLFDEERSSRLAWVAALIRQPDRFMYDHSTCWKIFAENKAFSALMELTVLSLRDEDDEGALKRGFTELSELVTLITKSDELVVFDAVFERVAVLPHSSEECLSEILSQIQTSVSIENRNERLCSAVIHALLNSVDLGYGMRLLARYPMLFAAAPLQTYHTIVETHVLTERQKHEIVQILEIVDTNVWASYKEDVSATSSVSFAPQLAAILQLEMDALFPAMSREQYELWEAKCRQYDEETKSHRQSKVEETGIDIGSLCRPISPDRGTTRGAGSRMSLGAAPMACRSFEYRNSDWGGEVQLHDSTCGTCDLPVVIICDSMFCSCSAYSTEMSS